MLHHFEARPQLFRYAVTGLAANALLYAAYFLLTLQGVGHKLAMSISYCSGVLCTFIFNRRWTFSHGGSISAALLRYLATYALGYVFVLAAQLLLVDLAGLPHRWVMATLIVISAGLIFLVQKYWVFSAGRTIVPG